MKEEKSKKSIDKFFDFVCNIEEKLELYMVKYFLVKVNKDWYATNKDALKEFRDKPVCVLKVNKLIKKNKD